MKIVYPKRFELTSDINFKPKPNTLNYFYTPNTKDVEKSVELGKLLVRQGILSMFSNDNRNQHFMGLSMRPFFDKAYHYVDSNLTAAQRNELDSKNINIINHHPHFGVGVLGSRLNMQFFSHVQYGIALFTGVEFLQHCLANAPLDHPHYFDIVEHAWKKEIIHQIALGNWDADLECVHVKEITDRIVYKFTVKSKFVAFNMEVAVEYLPVASKKFTKFAFVFFDNDISELYVNVFGHNIDREISDGIFDNLKKYYGLPSLNTRQLDYKLAELITLTNDKQTFWDLYVHQLDEGFVRSIAIGLLKDWEGS